MIQVFLRICGDNIVALVFCVGHLVATRNWCSLNASLKRSHAIPDGLKLFRALSVMLI